MPAAAMAAPAAAGIAASSIIPLLPLILTFVIPAVTSIAENVTKWEMEKARNEMIKLQRQERTRILQEVRATLESRRRESFRSVIPG